jgi:7-cyano-7-deazaguanine synthase
LGRAIKCGLTSADYDVFADAFLPGRNLYFLLIGASIAIQRNADAIAIGLLSEKRSQFPDQTKRFIQSAERVIHVAMGRRMKLLTPLMDLEKREVVRLASAMKVRGTYSCHAGGKLPCGVCIACREYS